MTIDYPLWDDLSANLHDNRYKEEFFTPEQYGTAKNPLESLVVPPEIDDFFATKVCNIFIVAIPFGWKQDGVEWVEDWPPEGYNDSKARHIELYSQFAKYETHVYMDMNIVKKIMDANPDSKFKEMMDGTKIRMQAMCDELADYGFKMEADITTEVGPDHFGSVLDEFYGID